MICITKHPKYGLEFLLAFDERIQDAETLIDDFFDEVERVLNEHGIDTTVVEVEETRRSR
jgi:hypothetical protein